MSRLLDGFDVDEEDEGGDDDQLGYGEGLYDEAEEMTCDGCGCSALHPCEGGCIWHRDNLCSRCA